MQLGKCSLRNFSDGEIWVKYNENIRGSDVFIIQSTIPPADNLMELLIMIDAAKRASARRVNAVIPYFGYARQDRKDQPRVSITAKLVANLITEAGADRVITMDLHASQLQGFFDIPVDHLYGSAVFMQKFRKIKIPNLAVASPDVGGIKMARAYAKRLHADLILIDKRRPKANVAEVMNIIGDVKGKNVLIIDDLIDTGGTFVNAVNALKSLDKINKSALKKLFVSDTLPLTHSSPKIETVTISDIFAESIWRTNKNKSISSLFDVDKAL
jgi:ribose-phosphate pyrophosphokinase